MARLAAGDARQALNHLELAVSVAASEGLPKVDTALAERVAQRVVAVYDKGREEHHNLISALHKSVRNSDPDAALYWLGRMLEGGADPRYVVRRMLRMASEDIGMADPRALQQVAAAAHAVEHVGMPECELALAQAAVYLALAPKSNALYLAYGAVQQEVRRRPGLPVPLRIRNAPTALMRSAGYGEGYRYAHDEADGVADMECLPEGLEGARFYEPTDRGWEARIRERLREIGAARRRKGEGTRKKGDGGAK
jgi:putative ATPase